MCDHPLCLQIKSRLDQLKRIGQHLSSDGSDDHAIVGVAAQILIEREDDDVGKARKDNTSDDLKRTNSLFKSVFQMVFDKIRGRAAFKRASDVAKGDAISMTAQVMERVAQTFVRPKRSGNNDSNPCFYSYCTSAARRLLHQKSETSLRESSITMITPLGERTLIHVPNHSVTGAENLTITSSNCYPSIDGQNYRSRHRIQAFDTRKVGYELIEGDQIALLCRIESGGNSGKILYSQRRITCEVDHSNSGQGFQVVDQSDSNLNRRMAVDLLGFRPSLFENDLRVWESELGRKSRKMTPVEAAKSINLSKSEWDECIQKIEKWTVLTEIARSFDIQAVDDDREEQRVSERLGSLVEHSLELIKPTGIKKSRVNLRKRIANRLAINAKTADEKLKEAALRILPQLGIE
jgi:hypothetical protein